MLILNVQKTAFERLSAAGFDTALFEARQIAAFLGNTTEEELDALLKRRIDGPNGHLSNTMCAEAVEFLAKTGTRQIVLSHLSKENNTPLIAYNSICNIIKERGIVEGENIRIDVASPNIGAFFRLK